MSEAAAAETAFEAFDWSSKEWQLYLSNLCPPPPLNRINHYRRKWFKANINARLELLPATTQSENAPRGEAQRASAPASSAARQTPTLILSRIMLFFGMLLTLVYILPSVKFCVYRYALMAYGIGLLSDVFSRRGTPRWTMEYWQLCLTEDSVQTLFLTVAALSLRSWLALVSPMVTAVLIFAETPSSWMHWLPTTLQKHTTLISVTRSINMNRYRLLQAKANFEVFLGFVITLSVFLRATSLMTVLLYWNAIRFKCQISPFTQATFRNIDEKLRQILSSPACPKVLLRGYTCIRSYLASAGQCAR